MRTFAIIDRLDAQFTYDIAYPFPSPPLCATIQDQRVDPFNPYEPPPNDFGARICCR